MLRSEHNGVRIEYDEAKKTAYLFGEHLGMVDTDAVINSADIALRAETLYLTDGIVSFESWFLRSFTELKRLILSDTIRTIDGYEDYYYLAWSLNYCKKLEYIRFSSGIEVIEHDPVSGCPLLREVYIPQGVRQIKKYAFCGCPGLERITVDENNQDYLSRDGVLFSNGGTTLRQFPRAKTGTYVLPEDTLEIDEGAFSGSGIEEVILHERVKRINIKAFDGCTSLRKINVSDKMRNFSGSAFVGCKSLETMTVGEHCINFSEHDGTIYSDDKAELIAVPKTVEGVYTVPSGVQILGEYAFCSCRITKAVLSEGVRFIKSRCFSDCEGLEEVVLHVRKPLPQIAEDAFFGCSKLRALRYYADDPSLPQRIDFGAKPYQTVYAPNVMLSDVRRDYLPAVAAGFAHMLADGEKLSARITDNAERFVRERAYVLYDRALSDMTLLKYLIDRKAIPQTDAFRLSEKAQDELSAKLLIEYVKTLAAASLYQ